MRDVRMKGFAERADVEEVERFLADQVRALPPEPVPLALSLIHISEPTRPY